MNKVFSKIYEDCMNIDFAISIEDYRDALWNEKVYKNTTRDFVIEMQNQAFK
jgi:hypothetical protein